MGVYVEVQCDLGSKVRDPKTGEVGCASHLGDNPAGRSVHAAFKAARLQGWLIQRHRQLCPWCRGIA